MKKIFFLLLVVFNSCNAQEAPGPLKTFSEKGEGIVKDEDLSDEQKKMLWMGVTQEKDGVLRIKSSNDYVSLIDTFEKHPDLKNELPAEFISSTKNLNAIGYKYIGVIFEDKYRTTVIYSSEDYGNLMFTKWRYKESGATITIAGSFINRSVNGAPAVLSLMSAEDDRAIWKCTWWKDGVNFEFYLQDKKDSRDNPRLSGDKVIEIANFFAD